MGVAVEIVAIIGALVALYYVWYKFVKKPASDRISSLEIERAKRVAELVRENEEEAKHAQDPAAAADRINDLLERMPTRRRR